MGRFKRNSKSNMEKEFPNDDNPQQSVSRRAVPIQTKSALELKPESFNYFDLTQTVGARNELSKLTVKLDDLVTALVQLQYGETRMFSDMCERLMMDATIRGAMDQVTKELAQSDWEIVPTKQVAGARRIKNQTEYFKELFQSIKYDGATGVDFTAFIGSMFDVRGYSMFGTEQDPETLELKEIYRIEPKRVRFAIWNTSYAIIDDVRVTDEQRIWEWRLKDLNSLSPIPVAILHRCATMETNKGLPMGSLGLPLLLLAALSATDITEMQRVLTMFGRPIGVASMTPDIQSKLPPQDVGEVQEDKSKLRLVMQRLNEVYGIVLPPGWQMKFEQAIIQNNIEAYLECIDYFDTLKVELILGSAMPKRGAKGGTNQQAEQGNRITARTLNAYASQIEGTITNEIMRPIAKAKFNEDLFVRFDLKTEQKPDYEKEVIMLNALKVPITNAEYYKRTGVPMPDGVDPDGLVMPDLPIQPATQEPNNQNDKAGMRQVV